MNFFKKDIKKSELTRSNISIEIVAIPSPPQRSPQSVKRAVAVTVL